MKKFIFFNKRSLTAILLSLVMILGLVGCGNGGQESSDTPDVAYVAEFLELEDIEFIYNIVNMREIDGILHIISVEYGETTGYTLNTYNLEDGSTTDVTLESAGGYFSSTFINEDGSIEALETKDEYDEEWNLLSREVYFNQYNADGTRVSSEPIGEKLGFGEEFYISHFMRDAEGNYLIGSWDSPLMIYSPEFVKSGEISAPNGTIDGLCVTGSGKVVASWWGNMGVDIAVLDVATKSFGTSMETGKSSGSSAVWPGAGDDVLYMDGTTLYSCDLNSGETTEIFNTMDMDINGEYVQAVYPLEDGKYLMSYHDWATDNGDLVIANPVDPSTIVERTELTLATIYPSQDLNSMIIQFNQTNTEYRIKVVDYSTEDYDFNTAMTNLQNDIIAGNVPDMIDMSSSNLPWRNWVAKGILTDLYPLMEADGEFAKEDILDNVREAYEVGESLYILPAAISINCTLANADNVEGITGLTPEILLEMEKTLPADAELFYWNDQSTAMYNMVYENMEAYVDYENGECYFDTDEFKAVLEYAKAQPAEFQYEEGVSVPGLLQTNKVIFYDLYMGQMPDYQFHKAIFGDDVVALGYATATDEDGIQIGINGCALAITEDCEYKDVAWQFAKSIIGEDYQNSNYFWGIPTTKDGLENFIYEAQHMDGTHGYGWDDVNMEITSATDEEIAEFRAMLDKADTAVATDQALIDIITEEVTPYFEGQKTADEVADIIQSRIDIYLKESM